MGMIVLIALTVGQLLVAAVKTVIVHFTSKNYPRDWDLKFHLQFAVLRQLQKSQMSWTVEEVAFHRLMC